LLPIFEMNLHEGFLRERLRLAFAKATKEVRLYMKDHPEFSEIGHRMLEEWENGCVHSLRG
jgi:hypothetical protein